MIQAAIPPRFYGDIREEVAQTVALGVLNREITLSELSDAVRQVAKQVNQTSLFNPFKFKSLDAPISADNPTSLVECLVG